MAAADEAARLIRLLALKPHPEGGHYRETFRDIEAGDGRAFSTAIYFLLKAGEHSRWHRIDAAEIWHWYAGAPLDLRYVEGGRERRRILGNDFAHGQDAQIVVPRGAWQCARSLGRYSLVGCTVAPGFLFEYFEMADGNFSPPAALSDATAKSPKRARSRVTKRAPRNPRRD